MSQKDNEQFITMFTTITNELAEKLEDNGELAGSDLAFVKLFDKLYKRDFPKFFPVETVVIQGDCISCKAEIEEENPPIISFKDDELNVNGPVCEECAFSVKTDLNI